MELKLKFSKLLFAFAFSYIVCSFQNVFSYQPTITVENNSGKTIWVGFVGTYRASDTLTLPGKAIGDMTADDYKLENDETKTFTTNVFDKDTGWFGTIVGRTGCEVRGDGKLLCETAHCPTDGAGKYGNANCRLNEVYKKFAYPYTHIYITYADTPIKQYSPISYALSLEDGYNIPIKIEPTPKQSFMSAQTAGEPIKYWCVTLGDNNASVYWPECGWDFGDICSSEEAPYYTLVSGNENSPPREKCFAKYSYACSNSDEVCGLISQSNNSTTHQLYCGKPLGYFTPKGVCENWGNDPNPPFDCNTEVNPSIYPEYNKVKNLYECSTPDDTTINTCYRDSECYGCSQWTELNVPPYEAWLCDITDEKTPWLTYVLPKVEYFKKACPSAFVYKFDMNTLDISVVDGIKQVSSVKCQLDEDNYPNYTITFLEAQPVTGCPRAYSTETPNITVGTLLLLGVGSIGGAIGVALQHLTAGAISSI